VSADRPHESVLTFDYDDAGAARLVATSLRQDTGEIDDDRSTATVEREGSSVRVRVAAADLTALRAALNTWGSLVTVAERTRSAAGADASEP
jgi:KEOPS complex subunit Pcc1